MSTSGHKKKGKDSTLLRWGKLLSKTGGAQAIIQGLGFLSGILIIRFLSTEQYAYYTLLNTMLGTMTNLADGGISTGVMAIGGKKWRNPDALGSTLVTGMQLRRLFAIGSLVVSVPILFYLLNDQGVAWWESILLILCVAPAFWAALSGTLLQIVPKLHQDIDQLLGINISVNAVRLLVTIPVIFVFPLAGAAVLSAGASQVYGNIRLRKLSGKRANLEREPNDEDRKSILETVKGILPGTIYYCISGQITIWLVAIFGDTESLAKIGALSRLVMLLSIVRMVINTVAVPRYARLPQVKSLVIRGALLVLGAAALVSAALIGFAYLFPQLCLWILGENYNDLEYELVLMITSGCLGMLSGVVFNLTSKRNIIPNPYLLIAFIIGVQILALVFFVEVSSLAGVIKFSIISSLSVFLYRLAHFVYYANVKASWDEVPEDD